MKARRVPPPNPEHLKFLQAYDLAITELVVATRALVLELAPDSVELIYDAFSAVSAGYSFTGRQRDYFVYIAAYAKGVNLAGCGKTEVRQPISPGRSRRISGLLCEMGVRPPVFSATCWASGTARCCPIPKVCWKARESSRVT